MQDVHYLLANYLENIKKNQLELKNLEIYYKENKISFKEFNLKRRNIYQQNLSLNKNITYLKQFIGCCRNEKP